MYRIFFKCSIILIGFVVLSFSVKAQEKYHSKSKKAIKSYESAFYHYKLGNFDVSKADLSQSIKSDKNFIDAYILLAEIANDENKKDSAIRIYQKAILIQEDYNPLAILRLAEIQKSNGNYAEAIESFHRFLKYKKFEKEYSALVLKKIKGCEFAIELMKKPVNFSPRNLGNEINSNLSEYWPSLTVDDSILVFTLSNRKKNTQEDLYYSVRKNNQWQKAQKLPPPVNSEGSEGAQTISADGKTMVFTACLRADGFGSCDLYISKKTGDKWTKPQNMGKTLNSQYKETQPSLAPDGKTIYFVSNRPGGIGKFDIWKSEFNQDESWSIPENLGDSINTREDELAPFIHYDNNTLYFTSEGHPGMGGSDVFISRRDNAGKWCLAKNAGYPINTHFNEESLVVTANGNYGLFSSNMEGGFGQNDIYQFEIPDYLKPNKTIFIKGLVYNAKTKLPLQSVVNVLNPDEGIDVVTESDEKTGEFLSVLKPGKQYAFHVNKKGFLFYSENFNISDSNLFVKIPLEPIEIGQMAILKNIFFELDSYALKEESYAELQKLIEFIKSNSLKIEIQGHTDNSGTQVHNQKLSENRAKAVFNYLVQNGINSQYLKYKGYGSTNPIASNETDAGKAKNRRTAFVILGKI